MTFQTSAPLTQLRLSGTAYSWGDLMGQVEAGELSYDTPYQRGAVWTDAQRIMLIHSILDGTPIPALIINERPWAAAFAADGTQLPSAVVIDGKQRLMTVRMFLHGELAVPASWFNRRDVQVTEDTADGKYVRFTGLSQPQQRFIKRATATVSLGKVGTEAEEAQIYLRVNGAGTPQTAADMERAARVAGR